MTSMVETPTQVRDTAGLTAALEAVLFTLNRPVTVLELQDILQATLPDIEAAAISLGQALAGRAADLFGRVATEREYALPLLRRWVCIFAPDQPFHTQEPNSRGAAAGGFGSIFF